jgi:D-glycero-D-manno-heptose 1,7-bisphosphate phosphatase
MASSLPQQCCVLVGGLGTRLGAHTEGKPKPLVDINGKPFLDRLLDFIASQGVTDIVLIAAHLGDQIKETYEGKRIGKAVARVVMEEKPQGTAGALLAAAPLLNDSFFLMNGDSLFRVSLEELAHFPAADDWQARLALRRMEDTARYGAVTFTKNKITRFEEKGVTGPGLINGGVYVLKRVAVKRITSLPASLEKDIFPGLAKDGLLQGHVFEGDFIDIGTPEDLARARRDID